jgi:hypothetical protein
VTPAPNKKNRKTIRTIPQERTPAQEQDPKVRATNFAEVACGYTLEEVWREAERCLMCPDEPCIRGCPVEIDIPEFIAKITEKNLHVGARARTLPAHPRPPWQPTRRAGIDQRRVAKDGRAGAREHRGEIWLDPSSRLFVPNRTSQHARSRGSRRRIGASAHRRRVLVYFPRKNSLGNRGDRPSRCVPRLDSALADSG